MTEQKDPAKPANPLATRAQIESEIATLRIERSETIQAVRDGMRRVLMSDPAARTLDGRMSLDRVLDQWIRFYTLMQLSCELPQPAFLWIADNTPRTWYGHTFPGDIVAGDNPDNTNRATFLDGDSSYELVGRFGTPKSGQFSLNLELADPVGIALGRHLSTLTDKQMAIEPDGSFRVTIDNKPADGRPNHMQGCAGQLNLTARDSRADWGQQATDLSLRLVSGPGIARARDENHLIDRIARGLPEFVDRWRQFKDGFFGFPEPNKVVLPQRRDSEGGWGYIGGGRFRLEPDQALVITMGDAGADYTGFQVTDPWTLRPETVLRTSSLNSTQARANPDGRCTYVIALQDPGVVNWIDTGGLREGWFQLRWQNIPASANPTADEAQLVRLDDLAGILPPGVPSADLAYRQAQIRERVEKMALRTSENAA